MRIFVLPPLLIVLGMSFSAAQDAKSELRTWTAVNGKEAEAEFVSNEKGVVKLKLKSGKAFEVPFNKLSIADRNFLIAKSYLMRPISTDTPSEKPSETLKSLSDADVARLLEEAVVVSHSDPWEERDGLFYKNDELISGLVKQVSRGGPLVPQGQVWGFFKFKDGKPDGLWMEFERDGQKKQVFTFKDGKQDGLYIDYYGKGQKAREGIFKEGVKYSLHAWHRKGPKWMEKTYKDGEVISTKYWNIKGEEVDSWKEAEDPNDPR